MKIRAAYDRLIAVCEEDPIMVALREGTIAWSDIPSTKEEEKALIQAWKMNEGKLVMASLLSTQATFQCKQTDSSLSSYKRVSFSDIPCAIHDEKEYSNAPHSLRKELCRSMVTHTHTQSKAISGSNMNQVKTLIARNLPREMTDGELKEALRAVFKKYGTLMDIYIPKNKDVKSPYYGTMKGFALIKYEKPTESYAAYEAQSNQLYLRTKLITVEYANEDR